MKVNLKQPTLPRLSRGSSSSSFSSLSSSSLLPPPSPFVFSSLSPVPLSPFSLPRSFLKRLLLPIECEVDRRPRVGKMGLMKKLRAAFGKRKKEAKIIVVGLDNSGKTTLINHLKPKKVNQRYSVHFREGSSRLYCCSVVLLHAPLSLRCSACTCRR